MGFASHDFRDLEYEVNYLRKLIKKVSKKYPDVRYEYTNTRDAFKNYLWGNKKKPSVDLSFKYYYSKNDVKNLLKNCGFEKFEIHHRHHYSWLVIAEK